MKYDKWTLARIRRDVTIIISSCDGYANVWTPLCYSFRKYWPDCPWPIQFITNFLDAPCGKSLKLGEDTNWSDMMRRALGALESPVVLFMTEDCWLSRKVNTGALLDFAQLIRSGRANYIRLSKASPSRVRCAFGANRRLVMLGNDVLQRTSLQPALWRVSTFLSLLMDGETPWVFEGRAPHRSRGISGFLTLAQGQHVFPYVSHVDPDWKIGPVCKGRWTTTAKAYAKREHLEIDFSQQPESRLKMP